MYLISACLIGMCSKYNGGHNYHPGVRAFAPYLCPVCPEQLGGMSTPREPAEIEGGDGFDVIHGRARVILRDGVDVTHLFMRGAGETLNAVLLCGIKKAILKDGSPSCGIGYIKDGTFQGISRKGVGVTTAYLHRHGIEVYNEKILSSFS